MAGRRLVERANEEDAVGRFLNQTGGASGLLLTGEAGIGKSTIWGLAIAAAVEAGLQVLSTRAAESETGLSFAGLADLLDRVEPEVLANLPKVQRDAIDAALMRTVRGTPAPRAVGAGMVSVLRLLAAQSPVLIAIDDLQWLDVASADVLEFSLRRVADLPVRLLGAVRTPSALISKSAGEPDRAGALTAALPPGMVDVLAVPALSQAQVADLIELRLARTLRASAVRELHQRTKGNPFWALEIVRGAGDPAEGLPVPDSLSNTVTMRLQSLSAEVRTTLTAVAALSHPSVALATRALRAQVEDPSAAIDNAVGEGVVESAGGRLRPAHPLLGSVALAILLPSQRKELHQRLADVVADPEHRAGHLAAAFEGEPSEKVAAALDAGVQFARARGATRSAIRLAELAIAHTPGDGGAKAARQLTAAGIYYAAGEGDRAMALARQASVSGPLAVRVFALCLLGQITYYREGSGTARTYLQQAVEVAGDDHLSRARALAALSDMGDQGARLDLATAQEALTLLADVDSPGAYEVRTAALLASVGAGLDLALGLDENALALAAESQAALIADGQQPVLAERVEFQTSWWYKVVDQLDRSRTSIGSAIQAAQDEGIDSALPNLFGHLALTECWAGRFDAARSAVTEGASWAAMTGWAPTALFGAAGLVEVLTGHGNEARQIVQRDLAFGEEHGHPRAVITQSHLLGLADLLDGEFEAAATRLSDAYQLARDNEIHEPGRRHRLEPDLGHALLAVGRLDEAEELAREQVELGRGQSRPGPLAIGLRIHGLVLAARGDLDEAERTVSQALAAAEASPFPLEIGRTHLALGQIRRRQRSKKQARDSLATARDYFVRLGSPPWQAIAEAELRRVGGTHAGVALTTAETRVAELVAEGRTNREIAAELFTSVRTVEGHLASVYRKLNVRGRVGLAQHLRRTNTEQPR